MLPGGMMPVTQLVALIRSSPPKGAAGLLTAIPADRLPVVVAALLGRLPEHGQHAVFAVMGRRRGYAVRSQMYVNDVADALARANADVGVPDGTPNEILLVHKLGWRIAVAARYGDDGRVAV